MMHSRGLDNLEFLRVAKDTSEQKGMSQEIIIKAIEVAIQAAGRKKYGNYRIKVSIDRKTGSISVYRELLVIADINEDIELREAEHDGEGHYKRFLLSEILSSYPNAKVGDVILEPLPPIDLDYNSAKLAKQRISQIIRAEERRKQYEEFKNRVGDLIQGIVKRVEYNNVIVELNGNEAYLSANNLIKGEVFRRGDRIKAYIEDVRQETSGSQIFLSRVHKGFVEQLFKEEIPEVYDGIVVIKSIARDPGSRAKVSVFSSDKNIDPVGACVGSRGSRIQRVINELNGEKIDVVLYSSDLGKFVVSAISPAEVLKVIIDADAKRIDLVVPEAQVSFAIGRKGQNIRLASESVRSLEFAGFRGQVAWEINVLGNETDAKKREEDLEKAIALFTSSLDIDEMIARLLFAEGFTSVESLAQCEISEITCVGFDEEVAKELKSRAIEYLQFVKDKKDSQPAGQDSGAINNNTLKSTDLIKDFDLLRSDHVSKLSEKGINTIQDIADLSRDDFYDIVPDIDLGMDEINAVIMEARRRLGWGC